MSHSQQQLTIQEAQLLVPNKKAMYEGLKRNQFLPPKLDEAMTTVEQVLLDTAEEYQCLGLELAG